MITQNQEDQLLFKTNEIYKQFIVSTSQNELNPFICNLSLCM